ncbi:hypothetical protein JYU34_009250 [Plutella xylostella]|uniref:Uncharacterized protein n=1 Tax=Plutella xylostella TaxID=51655 RepID=A0ABQ7QJ38_PLUXY|nr:hypothetical protein JYU34_009250 [Plutella xylostella]
MVKLNEIGEKAMNRVLLYTLGELYPAANAQGIDEFDDDEDNRRFYLIPASLGGVFNMFLGVGLFSALELIYFLAVKTPVAIRKGMEMRVTSAPGRRVDGRQHPFEIG